MTDDALITQAMIRELLNRVEPQSTNGALKDEWPEPEPLEPPLPPVLDFDDDLFPDALSTWALDVADRLGVPRAFVWSALMCTLGGIIGRRLGIRPKRFDTNWIVIPNLWGVVIGRPGTMKTPPVEAILRPLRKLAAKAHEKYAAEMKEYEEQLRQWNKSRDDDKGTPPTKPVCVRYLVNNFTVEKLGSILCENPRGVLVYRDELIGVLRNFERKGHENDRSFMLESWNGNSSGTYDTISRGTVYVPALCLSVIGTMSPGPFIKYLSDMFAGGADDDGFAQRLQAAVWPDPLKSSLGKDKPRDSLVYTRALKIFETLDTLKPDTFGANRDEHDPDAVPYVGFAPKLRIVDANGLSVMNNLRALMPASEASSGVALAA